MHYRFLLAAIQNKAAWSQLVTLLGRRKVHLIPTTAKLGLAVPGTDHSGASPQRSHYRQTRGGARTWSPVPTSAEPIAYDLGKPSSSRAGCTAGRPQDAGICYGPCIGGSVPAVWLHCYPDEQGPGPQTLWFPNKPNPTQTQDARRTLTAQTSLRGPWFAAPYPTVSLTCDGFHQPKSYFRCTILQLLPFQVEGARPSRGTLGSGVFVMRQ